MWNVRQSEWQKIGCAHTCAPRRGGGGLPPVRAESVVVVGKSVGDCRRKSPVYRYEPDVRKSSDVF